MDSLKIKLTLLPNKPGCYLMKDKFNNIIYVGKAKDLKNRVNSYFTGSHNYKTTKLVSEIADFDFVITNSNKEAFLLEINLIKKHMPKFNIALKDDKTYPYIALSNEVYPKLYIVRKLKKDKHARYFGPYPNTKAARLTLSVLHTIYPIRKCFNLKKEVCLYYHLNQCLAPCVNKDVCYSGIKKEIIDFLSGNVSRVIKELEEKMNYYSSNLEFERALEYKNLLDGILETVDGQNISSNNLYPTDYIGIYKDLENIAIHILYERNGQINGNYSIIIPIVNNYIDTILSFLNDFYSNIPIPKIICTDDYNNFLDLEEVLSTKIITPLKGSKASVLKMANLNAKKDMELRFNINLTKAINKVEVLDELASILNLDNISTIEAFDNSNLFGEYPISAMVRYKNLLPDYNSFRRFNVKYVKGQNDYETMKEVCYRRYQRLLMEQGEIPSLILMDGGKIQVNACLEVLASLNLDIPVAGLKKDSNHKLSTLFYNNKDIDIKKSRDVYLFLLKVSEKVHNYAISFFRSKKGKGIFSSYLDNIEGLGSKRKEILLKHFDSINSIKEASVNDIVSLGIPKNVAIRILEVLNE